MYKALALDLDGTLLQTAKVSMDVVNQVLKSRGFVEIDVSCFNEICHSGVEYLMKKASGIEDPFLQKQLLKEYIEAYKTNYYAPPYPHAIEVCEYLKKQGIKLAVYSNKVLEIVEKQLEAVELNSVIDLVKADDGKNPLKPNPKGLYMIAGEFSVDLNDILMVGDSQNDIETAICAGVDSCFFRSGIGSLEKKDSLPKYVIDDFNELIDIVL